MILLSYMSQTDETEEVLETESLTLGQALAKAKELLKEVEVYAVINDVLYLHDATVPDLVYRFSGTDDDFDALFNAVDIATLSSDHLVVNSKAWDVLTTMLNSPVEPDPRMVELFARPQRITAA